MSCRVVIFVLISSQLESEQILIQQHSYKNKSNLLQSSWKKDQISMGAPRFFCRYTPPATRFQGRSPRRISMYTKGLLRVGLFREQYLYELSCTIVNEAFEWSYDHTIMLRRWEIRPTASQRARSRAARWDVTQLLIDRMMRLNDSMWPHNQWTNYM